MVFENVGFSPSMLWARETGLEELPVPGASERMAWSIFVAASGCVKGKMVVEGPTVLPLPDSECAIPLNVPCLLLEILRRKPESVDVLVSKVHNVVDNMNVRRRTVIRHHWRERCGAAGRPQDVQDGF
jgi:hypothetical protein